MHTFHALERGRADQKKNGFTLIELLVVIAIIAILAAILFPVFARARENARRASCQSNLKNIALGIMQYTQDYDEKYPGYGNGTIGSYGWAEEVQPYMKSTQIYQCPSESSAPSSDPNVAGYTKYAINLYLMYDETLSVAGVKSLAAITQPTLTVLNLDAVPGTGQSWDIGCDAFAGNHPCSAAGLATFTAGMAQRHLDGQNFSFCDGHVKWYKAQDATHSAIVWNAITPLTQSGNSPTFNTAP